MVDPLGRTHKKTPGPCASQGVVIGGFYDEATRQKANRCYICTFRFIRPMLWPPSFTRTGVYRRGCYPCCVWSYFYVNRQINAIASVRGLSIDREVCSLAKKLEPAYNTGSVMTIKGESAMKDHFSAPIFYLQTPIVIVIRSLYEGQ